MKKVFGVSLLALMLVCLLCASALAQTTGIAMDGKVYTFTGGEGTYQADGKTFIIGVESVVVQEPGLPDRVLELHQTEGTEIMRVPFIGWILGKGGVFGVDRGHADMHAVKTALKLLKDGNKLLMFPEGTRVREGEDVAAKTGAAMFATRTGVPLVPIYIQRKKRLFARNAVVIGQPYHPQYAGRKPTPEELDAITGDLMDRVRALGEGQS